MTQGQATYLNQNIGTVVGSLLIASVALAFGLIIWHAAFGQNPVADALSKAIYQQQQYANASSL